MLKKLTLVNFNLKHRGKHLSVLVSSDINAAKPGLNLVLFLQDMPLIHLLVLLEVVWTIMWAILKLQMPYQEGRYLKIPTNQILAEQ